MISDEKGQPLNHLKDIDVTTATVIVPEDTETPEPQDPEQEALIAFLDLELRRLRWEIQQIVLAVNEIKPEAVCANVHCYWASQGRVIPHIRNTKCESTTEVKDHFI